MKTREQIQSDRLMLKDAAECLRAQEALKKMKLLHKKRHAK